jgi:hypothetical protein
MFDQLMGQVASPVWLRTAGGCGESSARMCRHDGLRTPTGWIARLAYVLPRVLQVPNSAGRQLQRPRMYDRSGAARADPHKNRPDRVG